MRIVNPASTYRQRLRHFGNYLIGIEAVIITAVTS
jgi:hypothetical protein